MYILYKQYTYLFLEAKLNCAFVNQFKKLVFYVNCHFFNELLSVTVQKYVLLYSSNNQMVEIHSLESIQSSGGIFVLNGRGEIALSQISIAMAL